VQVAHYVPPFMAQNSFATFCHERSSTRFTKFPRCDRPAGFGKARGNRKLRQLDKELPPGRCHIMANTRPHDETDGANCEGFSRVVCSAPGWVCSRNAERNARHGSNCYVANNRPGRERVLFVLAGPPALAEGTADGFATSLIGPSLRSSFRIPRTSKRQAYCQCTVPRRSTNAAHQS
jgi:hypothetical protein